MIHFRHVWLIVTLALCPLLSLSDSGYVGPRVDDLLNLLNEREVLFAEEDVRLAAVEGALKAIDPRSHLIDPEEIAILKNRKGVELAEMWSGDIGYIKMSALVEDGGDKVGKILHDWDGKSRGLVLDVRDAGGLDLGSVESIAGAFIGPGNDILHLFDGYETEAEETKVSRGSQLQNMPPVMLLANGNTFGACEALVAVLKGRRGVMVLGECTAGDAFLREIVPLSEDLLVCVATRSIVPESGAGYDSSGVTPDIVVSGAPAPEDSSPGDEVDEAADVTEEEKPGKAIDRDPVLRRAVDILLSLEAMGYGEEGQQEKVDRIQAGTK